METLNMYTALLQSIDREATRIAINTKSSEDDGKVKETYWKQKYKLLSFAVENMLSRTPDSDEMIEAIRFEMKKIIEGTY